MKKAAAFFRLLIPSFLMLVGVLWLVQRQSGGGVTCLAVGLAWLIVESIAVGKALPAARLDLDLNERIPKAAKDRESAG